MGILARSQAAALPFFLWRNMTPPVWRNKRRETANFFLLHVGSLPMDSYIDSTRNRRCIEMTHEIPSQSWRSHFFTRTCGIECCRCFLQISSGNVINLKNHHLTNRYHQIIEHLVYWAIIFHYHSLPGGFFSELSQDPCQETPSALSSSVTTWTKWVSQSSSSNSPQMPWCDEPPRAMGQGWFIWANFGQRHSEMPW